MIVKSDSPGGWKEEARPGLWPPVIGICGYSGAGKTTLIESVIPVLVAEGLSVAVIKHDAHRLSLDTRGKDTDRFYRAGADLLAHDSTQTFARWHAEPQGSSEVSRLEEAVELLGRTSDLVIVEGHKGSAVPKLWLLSGDGSHPPEGLSEVLDVLPRDAQRPQRALATIRQLLKDFHRVLPVKVGLLANSDRPENAPLGSNEPIQARRCSAPGSHHVRELAHRLPSASALPPFTSLEPGVVLLGPGGEGASAPPVSEREWVFSLPPVSEGNGTLAQIVSAFRWAPRHRWLILAEPWLGSPSPVAKSLLAQAEAGKWAVVVGCVAAVSGGPSAALYDPPMGMVFERALRREARSLCEVLAAAQGRVHHLRELTQVAGRPQSNIGGPARAART